ncbi:hypothetical protein GCM10009809_15670 [Isoptericola hypogeus]|uniref:SH3b domain-containing protein n=2 Tax=Isoptericola hypogeus TaxID=300179 RepID=A0ABP4VCM3_9MICO
MGARRTFTSGLVAAIALAVVAAGASTAAASPAAATGSVPGITRPLPDDSYGLSSYYGPRCMPIRGASTYHLGQDMGASRGTKVKAIRKGTVVKAGSAPGFGQVVVLRHSVDGRRIYTVHGHVVDGDRYVRTGQRVKQGQRIADVGSSGTSTSPHLHFEVWTDEYKGSGSTRDPITWMRAHGASLYAGAAWAYTRSVPSSCTYFTTGSVNLRTGPGTGYRVIRTVPVNRKLTAKPGDSSGAWRKVTRLGTVGWMHADYVSPWVTSLGTRYVSANGLRLRARPSTRSDVRATLSKGTAVSMIHPPKGDWVKVYVKGKFGYVAREYLRR